MPSLYIIATPIGNLEDLSPRAERILREADKIFCEDTRVTKKLLIKKEIAVPTESLHQHASLVKFQQVLDLLKSGRNIAYTTDAGTPGISDPGGKLIEYITAKAPELKIVPIPGPAALTAILQIAGFPADQFMFLGFVPTKGGRKHFFGKVGESKITCVFYESPHRIRKTVQELGNIDESSRRRIVIGRELTKLHEEIIRGKAADLSKKADKIKEKGEFTIALEGKKDF